MKKILAALFLLLGITAVNAQYNNDNYNNTSSNKGFKKENVFIGGSLSLGFGTGNFSIGGNPEIGYSVAQWLDAGLAINLNYASQRYYDAYSGANLGRVSSFNYGAGIFARAYPLPFLFVQVQPEENWIHFNQKDFGSDLSAKSTVNAASLIGAIGYSQRVVTQGSYFLMIGLDMLTDQYSPYRDAYNHAVPIIRGGFDIYLHPSRKQAPAGPIL